MKTEEIWRDIEGYEGLYQVSDLGRVRSIGYGKIRVLKPFKKENGYLQVGLTKEGKQKPFYVHRLVAEAFIPNPENLPQVNHKNELKTDNRAAENLEWCSREYNVNYGTRNERSAEKLSKVVIQYSKSGDFVNEWISIMEIERNTGLNRSHICQCCNGDRKSAYGFIWRYKNP